MFVFVCEQPGTAHLVTNEAHTQCSTITLRLVMIHYLGVIIKNEGNENTYIDTYSHCELSRELHRKVEFDLDATQFGAL